MGKQRLIYCEALCPVEGSVVFFQSQALDVGQSVGLAIHLITFSSVHVSDVMHYIGLFKMKSTF